MPKFMLQVSYTMEGLRGLIHDTAAHRAKVAEAAVKSVGGKMETMYWAFGEYDIVAIADLPDNAAASAIGMDLGASGAVRTRTTPLLTAAEVDRAIKKHVTYTPPARARKNS